MKSFRLILCVFSGVAVAGGVALGCGGDDTVVPVSNDGGSLDGSGVDAAKPDSGGVDSGTDSGKDGGGNVDSGTDSGVDAGPPPTAVQFIGQVAQSVCTRAEVCCEAGDAGTPNNTKCLGLVASDGFEGSSADLASLVAATDGGAPTTIAIDSASAQACVAAVAKLPCTVNAAEQQNALALCLTGALRGTQATNGACTYSIECAQPAYCQFAGGVSPGTCQPLVAAAGDCSNVLANGDPSTDFARAAYAQNACSSLGTGAPASLFCDNYDFVGNQIKPITSWVCAATNAATSPCLYDQACASLICDQATGDTCQATESVQASDCAGLE